MRQASGVVLDESVGYLLKHAASTLRSAMEAVLRPLELTVPQYACLELLGQRLGLSNADLARGAFVTRQSMDGVLQGLRERGLVSRADVAPSGRSLPVRLTDSGRERLGSASRAVRAVELKMTAGLEVTDRRQLLDTLAVCVRALLVDVDEES